MLICSICGSIASSNVAAAAAPAQHRNGEVLDARSAGLSPENQVSEVAADVLMGRGIDIMGNTPRLLTDADLESADIVITLVRDVEIEVPDGVGEETWFLPDPASWTPQHLEPLIRAHFRSNRRSRPPPGAGVVEFVTSSV